jgi:hypothetical protein
MATETALEHSVYNFYTAANGCGEPSYHSIVKEEKRKLIAPFLKKLPAAISSLWGYEVRLRDTALKTDFQICVSKTSNRSFLEFLSDCPFSHPLWERFHVLTARWTDGDDAVCALLRNIWLEMDACEMESEDPVPNFFFAPVDGLATNDFEKVTRYIFSILGIALTSHDAAALKNIHSCLPSGTWIPQIGMMASRPGEKNIRLFVHHIQENQLIPFLKKIEYDLDYAKLEQLQHEMHDLFDFVDVNVETNHGSPGVIGLEGYFHHWDEQKLHNTIAFLERKDLISRDYISCLRSYFTKCQDNNDKGLFHQEFIHHFKIVFSYDHIREAKLYLGVKRLPLWPQKLPL